MASDSPKREWVVGFLFDEHAETVVLVRKNRPEWQAGLLNGVGGKVEPLETPQVAMAREFDEETGVAVQEWHHFLDLTWEEGVVHFFRAFESMTVLNECHTTTDEAIGHYDVNAVITCKTPMTPNLRWLIPLAAHRYDDYEPIEVVEAGTTLRKVGRAS